MATISRSQIACAPGNVVVVPCSGFATGPGTLTLTGQGGAKTATVVASGTIVDSGIAAPDGTTQTFTLSVPDGITSAPGTLSDGVTTVPLGVRVESQYVQASEYQFEGFEADPITGVFAPGVLDVILRRASSYADVHVGGSLRLMQNVERHTYNRSRRIYPFRRPIVSVDLIKYITSSAIATTFTNSDIYVNPDKGYVELLGFAFGQYALLGAIETIGYSANVFELTVTAGYASFMYPQRLREAVIMIASDILTARRKRLMGIAGLKAIGTNEILADGEPFAISAPAKDLLRPFIPRTLR